MHLNFNNQSNMLHTIDDIISAFIYTVIGFFASNSVGSVIDTNTHIQMNINHDLHELFITFCKYGIGATFSITTFIIVFFVKRYLQKKYKSENYSDED